MSRALPTLPQRVTVLGLGLFGGGAGAARYFAEHGATVTVSDLRAADELRESILQLAGLPIAYHLGAHQGSDLVETDLVIVNPAVPPDAPALRLARAHGVRLDTEINLLFTLCPAPIAAVTGTNGKSTTVAMLGEAIRAGGRRAWVGGNLGGSLLPKVEEMDSSDAVVLEISSFQAERLPWCGKGPHVAVATNLTPNHLDRHADMAEYAAAKQQLLRFQTKADFAVLNACDPAVGGWGDIGRGQKLFIGAPEKAPAGAREEGDGVRLWRGNKVTQVSMASLRVLGGHNRFNAMYAAAAAWLMGTNAASIARGLAAFAGLPDRIEFVFERGGVRFYNDSIATTPESTFAALEAFESPIVLIAGGSSKNLSFTELGRRICRRVKAVVLMGATADAIERSIRAGGVPPPIQRAPNLEEAVRRATEIAAGGDIVLLSPACASYDMFRNYAERGERFKRCVRALE